MGRGDDRGEAEPPREAHGEIDQRNEERDQYGDRGVRSQLRADAWPDELASARGNVIAVSIAKRGHDDIRRAVTGGCLTNAGVWLGANRVLGVRAEPRDLRIGESRLVNDSANIIALRRLLELQLYERTASELDAVIDRVNREEPEANDDPGNCQDRRLLPVPDEVVLGVVKDT